MKSLIAVVGCIAVAQSLIAVDGRSERVRDFDLGGEVGTCLLVKCQIFRGVMLADSLHSGTPVGVKVQEWIWGEPSSAETQLVPYDDRPHQGLGGTSVAWRNTRFAGHGLVTVVMALESTLEVNEGEPALVTFDERDAGLIRVVAEEALRLKRNPQFLSADVAP